MHTSSNCFVIRIMSQRHSLNSMQLAIMMFAVARPLAHAHTMRRAARSLTKLRAGSLSVPPATTSGVDIAITGDFTGDLLLIP